MFRFAEAEPSIRAAGPPETAGNRGRNPNAISYTRGGLGARPDLLSLHVYTHSSLMPARVRAYVCRTCGRNDSSRSRVVVRTAGSGSFAVSPFTVLRPSTAATEERPLSTLLIFSWLNNTPSVRYER